MVCTCGAVSNRLLIISVSTYAMEKRAKRTHGSPCPFVGLVFHFLDEGALKVEFQEFEVFFLVNGNAIGLLVAYFHYVDFFRLVSLVVGFDVVGDVARCVFRRYEPTRFDGGVAEFHSDRVVVAFE